MITIDDAVRSVLVGIYSSNTLSDRMYLKGGQALRVSQNLRARFSKDSDFSIEGVVGNEEAFFKELKESIASEFLRLDLYVIDFEFVRKPKFKPEGTPDFWQGWAVEFKLITRDQINLTKDRQSASAIVPEGSQSNKILIDISEMEYCGSFEMVKVESVEVKVYSRVLLVVEKIRAICQSHPDYKYRLKKSNRARDFFDIEQLCSKSIVEGAYEELVNKCRENLDKVFDAKEVPPELILKCVNEESFFESQKFGWEEVKSTVSTKEDFSYYFQFLKDLCKKILSS